MPKSPYEKAKTYAQRLIDYRPRSENELKNRLIDKGYDTHDIDRIIGDFKAQGLIDDKKFARLWAGRRLQSSRQAPAVIRRELLLKQVDKDIVEDAISRLSQDFNEEEAAGELVDRRLKTLRGIDKNKARQRLFGYLKRRGFSSTVIYRLLGEISN